MHQDAEQFADRVKHLEKKEAEAKKLQRVAKKEGKQARREGSEGQETIDKPSRLSRAFAPSAGTTKSLQEAKQAEKAAPEWAEEGGEGNPAGKRRSQIDSKVIEI